MTPVSLPPRFRAFVVREDATGRRAGFEDLALDDLPDGDLTVQGRASTTRTGSPSPARAR
jgi:hypothetical protein